VLELDSTQTVANPFVQTAEDTRGISQPEVTLPAHQILPKFLRYLYKAPPTTPAGYLPDAVFHPHKGSACDSDANGLARGQPKGKPEEVAARRPINRALGLVYLEPELAEPNNQRTHHALTGPLRPDEHAQIVCNPAMRHDSTTTIWVGMDVHQASITAAILHGDQPEPEIVRLPGGLNPTRRLFRRLTSVTVPDENQEAVRHLVRARLFRQRQITRSKHRIMGILRTTRHRFTGTKSNWTKKHRIWLASLRRQIDGPLHTVLTREFEYLEYLETSQSALDAEIAELARRRPWRTSVEALCCFKGIKTLTAMTIVSEIGDIKRFRSPRQLMGYTGLVPGERSSGDRQRRGPITRAGNRYLRRVLVESAWQYSKRSYSTLILQRRRMGQDPGVVAIAIKAQQRLQRRHQHLSQTKHTNKATTAVARELCGFLWSALWELEHAKLH
jgi:transposase